MTPLVQEMIARAMKDDPTFPEHFKWFDISDVEAITEEDGIHFAPELNFRFLDTPLPFDQVAIVLADVDGTKAIICASQNSALEKKEGIACRTWVHHLNGTVYRTAIFTYRINENNELEVKLFHDDGKEKSWEEIDDGEKSNIYTSTGYIALFLNSLQTRTTTVYEAIRRKNHEKRIRQGKAPLFDWRTVVIEPVKVKREPLGGTHASPRLHDRRGHWRFIRKSQKRVWVRDCKVGDASKGVVFHDYKVTGGKV